MQTCPECKKESRIDLWEFVDIWGCDICGSHSGTKCPECGEQFDLVYNDLEYNPKTFKL
jgi:ssDNA-binding Zn-finger/Zn-ribbon topoisomerase 1